ncbi:ATP-binding protein [Streptomyces sp. HC44]|uniref:ATP-binding protein n=1 Tax=Streptomyces scabichelini TaxID=2711217 RepID=A0A6G4VCR2_9ACTN|nr:ATP-binding protein [Streptomyces scabichelini]NGO11856.1 ATP-binding protein [Streptomyces scabichelini]
MDTTNNRGPEEHGHDEHGHDDDVRTPRQRPPRDPLTQALGPGSAQHTPALARTVQLVSGDFLLTVNPVDGSEIELCPPGERPARPVKFTPAERAELAPATRPPVPPGPLLPRLPLLERQEERERLARLLARGRSVRLTGPSGSGRTVLLDAVADDCADLAPDGVIRLSGHRRTPSDLLHDLFAAVYSAPLYRPELDELLTLVREIGAVVVLDDIEFGGSALDELLDATPECAFLISATPEVAAPSADSLLEEVFLGGLGRGGGLELLERAVGRVLTEDEAAWAGDLWFESEGLPLRFVQAGALLRQRDQLRADPNAFDEYGYYEDAPVDAPFDADDLQDVPLPSLAEGAAPAALLASRLSDSARDTLRFAVALDGEVPHQAHLPALVGDTHADAALAELVGCGLVTPVGSHYRLAADVQTQLEAAGFASHAEERARIAAQHYAWWAGHPSVTPERVAAEADAVLAALTALVPITAPPADEEDESAAVRLARAVAPAFAGGLHWGAWERTLRAGTEASRLAGEVSEQAYFHHELGVLAICGGQFDRARAELEASIGLRGALADKRGTVAGRRALALVDDRTGATPSAGLGSTSGEEVPDARYEESASPPGGVPAAFAAVPPPQPSQIPTLVTNRSGAPASHKTSGVKRLVHGTRRNLVAAAAGALLAAVLGTVVTLGATSNGDDNTPSEKVGVNPSASAGENGGGLGAEEPRKDSVGDSDSTSRPTDPGEDGVVGTSDDPTPSASGEPSDDPSGSKDPSDPTKSPTQSPTKPPSTSKPPTTSRPPTTPPPTTSRPPTTSQPPTSESPTVSPSPPPENSTSASGPAPSTPVSSPAESSSSASGPDEPPSGSGTTGTSALI